MLSDTMLRRVSHIQTARLARNRRQNKNEPVHVTTRFPSHKANFNGVLIHSHGGTIVLRID